jgi:hypothetical protein
LFEGSCRGTTASFALGWGRKEPTKRDEEFATMDARNRALDDHAIDAVAAPGHSQVPIGWLGSAGAGSQAKR